RPARRWIVGNQPVPKLIASSVKHEGSGVLSSPDQVMHLRAELDRADRQQRVGIGGQRLLVDADMLGRCRDLGAGCADLVDDRHYGATTSRPSTSPRRNRSSAVFTSASGSVSTYESISPRPASSTTARRSSSEPQTELVKDASHGTRSSANGTWPPPSPTTTAKP